MNDVIQFPKSNAPSRVKTPEQALEYVLNHLRAGDTSADNLIIAWSEETGDGTIHYRYLVGGQAGTSATVGLLEIAKASMIEG